MQNLELERQLGRKAMENVQKDDGIRSARDRDSYGIACGQHVITRDDFAYPLEQIAGQYRHSMP